MKDKCYVTTPIYYASGKVQVGNTYTTVACDALARFNRQMGRKTFYLTGMDEHGQKIAEAATKANLTPQAFVDQMAEDTKKLWQTLHISYDYFIRTTDKIHEEVVANVFEKLLAQDDIYLGSYQGHYCVSCETFFTKTQLGENNTCPDCGKPTKLVSEESYFLRLKKYSNKLLDYIKNHPDFIMPETRRNEVISFIEAGLEDLCVSRTSFSWGIKVKSNPKHVIYVWIDALFNYLTALGYGTKDEQNYQNFWLDNDNVCHVVGKDILRFHAIYWPIMLMALDIPIKFKLYVHGWILAKDGKMSKSRGNAVYPTDMVNRYGVDALRYYLTKELPLGNDGLFSCERFVERYNAELANDLGNLVSRTIAMINKYFEGIVPKVGEKTPYDDDLILNINENIHKTIECFDKFELQNGITATWNLINRVNKYIDETAPWVLAKEQKISSLQTVMNYLATSLKIIAYLVAPYLVETSPKILRALGLDEKDLNLKDLTFLPNLAGQKVTQIANLFNRLDLQEEQKYFATLEPKAPATTNTTTLISIDEFMKASLKVGQIIEATKHPNADKLLVSKIKIGDEIKQIVSGIAKFYDPKELIGKKVIVVCNLAPAKVRGILSEGMVLCASHNDELELIEIKNLPSGAIVK